MGDLFKIAVQHVSVALLAALGAAWLVAWAWREHRRACAKLSPGTAAALLAMAFAATIEAQKRSLPSGGNGVPGTTAFAPPPGAATNGSWLARGAYEDWFYLRPTNWWARAADGGWIGALRVFSFCGFQARHEDGSWNAYPPPFPQKLSLAPMANWGMLVSHGGTEAQSFFWHCVTESNTLVLTWQDALYARSHTNLVSFQAELFNDGAIAYRYDGSPVATNDFVHPAPTNWNYGVTYAWDDSTVNSNAYYWVEVAAERGPAAISFAGDRESALGDPVVVTRGGETNRVPLLIGIRYAVTSDVPFAVSLAPDNMYATVTTNNPASFEVHWPLEFAFTEGFADGNRVYAVDVVPYDPGGVFSWEMRGGVSHGGLRSGGCGCVSYSGRSIVFGCTSTCECGGTCAGSGAYMLESAIFAATGGVCRCGFDDPEPPGEELPPGPGLSVSFSKDAVIYEDTYEDSPGVWKPKRSTRVRLTVSASGGPHGGTLWLTTENLDKLSPVACGPLQLPSPVPIAAGDGYSVSFLCEAAEQSITEDDVIVSGVFTENNTGQAITNAATLTVVRVELLAEKVAPQNPCINRHVYGVDEKVNLLQAPAGPVIQWSALGNGCVSNLPYICYICPIRAETGGLAARHGTVTYRPLISVREPEGLECRGYGFLPATGIEGIGMALALYVFPYDVSFEGLKMQEVAAPSNATSPEWGVHEGYFSDWAFQGHWYHYAIWGAGVWKNVRPGNKFGEQDESRMFIWPEPWSAGRMSWKIPIAWKSKHSSAAAEGGRMFETYQSEWTMILNSVIKTKHQQELTLTENGLIFLNGERYDP